MLLSLAHGRHAVGDFFLRLLDVQAVEEIRIRQPARSQIGFGANFECFRIFLRRNDNRNDVQLIFAREIQVTLVVARAAEDGAGSIIHQDEVGDIDRQLLAGNERVLCDDAGIDTLLLRPFDILPRWFRRARTRR